ncbi:MAG: hypothetical protein GF334_10030 [Candidatus Altiarchaeales archaeon]|nr:hypothetical protein [Candidatus Altiarchaeales archaeon]
MQMISSGETKKTLFFLCILSLTLYVWGLYKASGVIHPDELFQILEPAHKIINGYGETTWEYVHGMRHIGVPIIASYLIRLNHFFGITNPLYIILVLDYLTVFTSISLVLVVYLAGRKYYSPNTGLYAALFTLFSPIILLYGTRFNPHLPAALFLVLAFHLLSDEKNNKKIFLSGLFLGCSFFLRYTSLILTPVFLWRIRGLRKKDKLFFLAGSAFPVFLVGLLDQMVWGVFLHSVLAQLNKNVLEGVSDLFGVEHALYYLLFLVLHLPALYATLYCIKEPERLPLTAFSGYLLVLSLIPHKELRFLIEAAPFFMLAAGRGLEVFSRNQPHPKIAAAGFLGLSLIFTVLTPSYYLGWGGDAVHQATYYVGTQKEAEALAYMDLFWWQGSGSHFLFTKPRPLVHVSDDPTFNPQLQRVNCSQQKYKPQKTGFQCIPPKEFLQSNIKYVLAAKNSTKNNLSTAGFTVEKNFGHIGVFTRP